MVVSKNPSDDRKISSSCHGGSEGDMVSCSGADGRKVGNLLWMALDLQTDGCAIFVQRLAA